MLTYFMSFQQHKWKHKEQVFDCEILGFHSGEGDDVLLGSATIKTH